MSFIENVLELAWCKRTAETNFITNIGCIERTDSANWIRLLITKAELEHIVFLMSSQYATDSSD